MSTPADVARRFYQALADGDGQALFDLLTDDFEGVVSAGMPHDVGGEHHGRVAMITDVWGRIDAAHDLDVAFAHIITVRNEQITALQQITDTVRWRIPT